MENNELKNVRIKNRMCYNFDDIIKLEDFDLDNISINEKSYQNIFIYDISYKTIFGSKHLRIRFELDKSKKQYHIYFFSLFFEN